MPRTRISPRKAPRQDRSRATVDALVQATADILERRGAARLTTNAIAERAGVNIASLYQYFPNKASLVAEVRRRHVDAQRAAAERVMAAQHGRGLEAMTRALVAMGVAAHTVAPRLHHALAEAFPGHRPSPTGADEAPLYVEARRLLAREGVGDVDLVLWMVDTVSHAVIHGAVVERAEDLACGRVEDELVKLLVRYLRGR